MQNIGRKAKIKKLYNFWKIKFQFSLPGPSCGQFTILLAKSESISVNQRYVIHSYFDVLLFLNKLAILTHAQACPFLFVGRQ